MADLIAKRYASALFDLAYQELKINEYEKEIKELIEVLKAEPDFLAFLNSEKVSNRDKSIVINNVFKDRLLAVFIGLMKLLVEKNRQRYLVEILESFLEISKARSNVLKAKIISAVELNTSQIERIKNHLEIGTKKPVELTTEIDSSIIGGLIIKVGDQAVDASIQGKLQKLKKQLMKLKTA